MKFMIFGKEDESDGIDGFEAVVEVRGVDWIFNRFVIKSFKDYLERMFHEASGQVVEVEVK